MVDTRWIFRAGITLALAAFAFGCAKKRTVATQPSAGPLESKSAAQPAYPEAARLDSRDIDGTESDFIPPVDMLQFEETGFPPPAGRAPAGPKIQIPELQTVYFDYDASAIRPDQEIVLRDNAQYLLAAPAVRVEIQGHCDERGTEEYNLALGERRALAIRAYLTAAGVEPERVFTISYGEAVPAAEGSTEAAYSQNRRAEFWIISE